MSAIYLVDTVNALIGPITLPVVPGIGAQIPGNAVQLAEVLEVPAAGCVWALVENLPRQLADNRGTVYSTETGVSQEHVDLGDLPDGLTTEARPSADYAWMDGRWQVDLNLQETNAREARLKLLAKIDNERDQRINAGVEFQGVMFQSRATDRENIAGAAQLGFMAVVGGAQAGDLRWSNPEEDFAWIASDNSLVPMDAPTVVAFGKAAAGRKQALIFAGRQLKDMTPVPADFTDDKWWH